MLGVENRLFSLLTFVFVFTYKLDRGCSLAAQNDSSLFERKVYGLFSYWSFLFISKTGIYASLANPGVEPSVYLCSASSDSVV